MLAVTIAAALAGGIHSTATAAGLGRLTVQSALGQPLQAEVEITSLSREELATLSARLAAPDAFRQAGIDFNPALSSLRFAIDRRPDGRAFVRITSTQAINEPFVDLLVELNWAAGKFVREYTFLLDPPELRIGRATVEGGAVMSQVTPPAAGGAASPARRRRLPAAAASAPVAAPTTAAAPAPSAQVSPTPAAAPAPAPAPSAAAAPSGPAPGAVEVQRGDNLTAIAERVKPADIAVEQAIVAIYNANPRAFFGTVHQMYAGRTLNIPDRAAMESVNAAQARRQIRIQAAEFRAYRERLAAATRTVDTASAGTTATGAVTATVEEAAPAATGDRLQLSRSTPQADGAPAAGSATGSENAQEAAVAGGAALREQQERVALLEKNVSDLQQLLELKNRQLAELQQKLELAEQAPRAASGAVSPATPAAVVSQSAPVTTPATAADASPAAPASTPAPTATARLLPRPTLRRRRRAPAPAPVVTRAPTPAPAPAPSFIDELLGSPLFVPGLAAIIIALGGFGWYTMRRRRKAENFEDSLIAADAFTANSLFGTTGGQAVDTNNPSMFGPSLRDDASEVHSTEVDPIAEAEVYIAYGREAQAEEILREALKRQPERQAIRLKLLEILAGRKDVATFGLIAQEMYDLAGGRNEEWPRVVAMGLALDPSNALYSGGGEVSAISGVDAGPDLYGDSGSSPQGAAEFEGFGAARQSESDELEAPESEAAELEVGVPPTRPMPSGIADSLPIDFAETQAMEAARAKAAGDEPPALDFSLDIDTSIGRPDDAAQRSAQSGDDGAANSSGPSKAVSSCHRSTLVAMPVEKGSPTRGRPGARAPASRRRSRSSAISASTCLRSKVSTVLGNALRRARAKTPNSACCRPTKVRRSGRRWPRSSIWRRPMKRSATRMARASCSRRSFAAATPSRKARRGRCSPRSDDASWGRDGALRADAGL
jgi:pilus assembly protein FimV